MKTWKRMLSALLALVLLLTPVTMLPVEAAETTATEENTLYVFDMEQFIGGAKARHGVYDYLKFATALQGLVNRERPQLFFYSLESSTNKLAGIDIDEVWLDYITDPSNGSNMLKNGEDLSDYTIEHVEGTDANFWALVTKFRSYADGIILWDNDVPATANVASTIAGVEDLLPVRYATARDDLYTQLINGAGGKWTVKRTLVDLFDGETMPTLASSVPGNERKVDTSIESTGSIKNDPYIWAMEHYLETGKTNANLMAYSIDAKGDNYRTLNPDHPIDAEFVSSNIPATMQAGSVVPVQITVKNTGEIDWELTDTESWPNPVRLAKADEVAYSQSQIINGTAGTWQDWADYHATHFQMVFNDVMRDPSEADGVEGIPYNPCGGRASRLDISSVVAPGEEYTFSFCLVAPTEPGSYEFALRMLQDKANSAFPAGIFSNIYYVDVDVTEEPVVNNGAEFYEAEDSVDYLCAYDSFLHTEKGKGAYDVTKNLSALQAHMVYQHEDTVKVLVANTGNGEWTADAGYALRYSIDDGDWQTIDLGMDIVDAGGSMMFEIPVSAADVAEDCKSAENVRKAGDEILVTAHMAKDGLKFGETFTKTVTVKPSFAGKLVSNTIPEEIMADAKQKIAMTYINTGSIAWTGDKLETGVAGLRVALTSGTRYLSSTNTADDTEATHGYNRQMANGVVVQPGDTYTFYVDLHTYPNPLSSTTVATETTTSNIASTLNLIVNTQGDLAGNQQFSDNYKFVNANHVIELSDLREVVINEENPYGDDMAFATAQIPDVMTVNEVAQILLELKNTGTSTWYTTDHTSSAAERQHQIGTDENGDPIYCEGTQNHVCTVDVTVLDDNFRIYNGYTSQNEDGTLEGAWGTKSGKGYQVPGLTDIEPGGSKYVRPYLYAPSEPGVYVLRITMCNPSYGSECFRTGYEKVIRVIEADTERENNDGSVVYLDANYRPSLPQEIVSADPDDVEMSENEMDSVILSARTPTSMMLGEAVPVAITFMNTGTERWNRFNGADASDVLTNARMDAMGGANGETFRFTKDQEGTNGWVSDKNTVEMTNKFHVYPGSAHTFTGWLHAPSTVGVYPLRFQMSNAFGYWGFGEKLTYSIIVGMNSEIFSVGKIEAVNNLDDALTIKVKNTGEGNWEPVSDPASEEGYVLKYTFNGQTSYQSVPETMIPNQTADFECLVNKPSAAGEYTLTAEMVYRTAGGTEYTIGDPLTTQITVKEKPTVEQTLSSESELAVTENDYGVQIVSVQTPKSMQPGEKAPIAVTIKNTGKNDLISKYGNSTGNTDGVRVYFSGQGFMETYNEETWQSDPNAFDTVNTTDFKLAMEDKFFVYNSNGDGRTASRYGVVINDRGNNECSCLDLKNGTVIESGDTYTYVGWIVAPYTEGNYEIKIFATADVNKDIRSSNEYINIPVCEYGTVFAKEFVNETYSISVLATYARTGLFNSALPSSDYYIANKAFFFDLSPDDTIAPMDDRTQPVGTDVATLRKLFHAQMVQAQSRKTDGDLYVEGTGIFTVGGFYPWAYKYSNDVDTESLMDPFHGEFHMVDIASEYGGQTDADAFGTIGLNNASVYQHIALDLSGSAADQTKSTFNPNTYCKQAYDANKNYIMFYLGDYDGASWVGNLIDAIYNETDENGNLTRGDLDLPLAWQVNANLADRIPHVYNMLYKNATASDYFVVGNNGTGYFNVHWALNPRDPSITEAQTAQLREDWIAYNRRENARFDLGIQGFIQPTTSSRLSSEVMDVYRETTPLGVADAQGVRIGNKKLHHGIYDANAADGGTPFLYNVQLARLDDPATYDENVTKVVNNIRNAMLNNDGMVSASSVKWLPSQVEDVVNAYNAKYPNEPLTVVDPYTYFRLYRQKMAAEGGAGMIDYPEIKLAGANVSFGESLRLTMAYTFEGLDISGIDMNTKSGIVVWREASEASQFNLVRGEVTYGEQLDGLTLVPGTTNVYAGETSAYLAKDIDKYLYIRAFVSVGGTLYWSDMETYSVQKYARNMADSGSAELQALTTAALNYAAEAQTFAGEVRDADNILTAAEKKLNFSASSIRQPAAINASKTTTDTAGYFPRAYQNIRLNDNFNLLLFWQIDPSVYATASDSGVLVWTEDQYNALKAAPSVSNAGTKLSMTSTTINGAACYGAEYTGIAARSIDQGIYACAYMTINGVTYYSDLLPYSIHLYAQNMISRGGNIAALAKRVIVYGDAAKAYYESK